MQPSSTWRAGSILSIALLLILPSLRAQPDNDRFADRTRIEGASVHWTGATLDATREAGETATTGAAKGEASVWWSWLASADGLVRVIAAGPDGMTTAAIRVSRGATVETLTPVAPVEVAPRRGTFFRAHAGERYELGVVAPTATPAFFSLQLEYVPDTRASLGWLAGNHGDLIGSTVGAAAVPELADPSAEWPTVYWDWLAPGVGTLQVGQFNEDPGVRVTIYRQRPDGGFDYAAGGSYFGAGSLETEVGVSYRFTFSSVDVEPGPFRGYFTWSTMGFQGPDPAVPLPGHAPVQLTLTNVPDGVTFVAQYVYSTGYSAVTNTPPQFTFAWQPKTGGSPYVTANLLDDAGRLWLGGWIFLRVRPPNDAFADAELLQGETVFRRVSTTDATLEPGEPNTNGITATTWYRWIAPAGGQAGFQLARQGGLASNVLLSVFRGTDLENLTPAGSSGIGERRKVLLNANPGDTFWIRAANASESYYPVCLLVRLAPPVINDAFANRTPLAGTSADAEFEAMFTSKETGESGPYDGLASRTAWYTWTSPGPGELSLTTSSSDDAIVKGLVYSGSDWLGLRRHTGIETASSDLRRYSFTTLVAATTNYQIQVDSHAGTNLIAASPARLHLAFEAAPANDEFTNRTLLTGERIAIRGTTRAARGESQGPSGIRPALQAGATGYRAVWYEWTAPRSMRVTLAITGPDGAFGLPFRKGELSQLALITTSASTTRTATFSVAAGLTYLLAITSFDSSLGVDFEAHLFPTEPPPNDNFADRTPLAGTHVVFEANHESATGEPLDPAGRSVWWTWTAPVDGWATLLAPADAQCLVWTGPALGSLKPVTIQHYVLPAGGSSKQFLNGFDATAGTAYQISVRRSLGATPAVYPITLDLTTWRLADPGPGAVLTGGAPAELRYAPPDAAVDGVLQPPGMLYRVGMTGGTPLGLNTGTPLAYALPAAWTINPNLPVIPIATNVAGVVRYGRPESIQFRPVNDLLARAVALAPDGQAGAFLLSHATREPGEPDTPAGTEAGSIWWRWTAAYSGMVTWAANMNGPVSLRLYTGSSFPTLSLVAEDYGSGPFVNARVTGGTSYLIALTGPEGVTGSLGASAVIPAMFGGAGVTGLRFQEEREFPVEVIGDPAEIAKVELLRNGVPVFSSTQPPYRLELPWVPEAAEDRIAFAVWFHNAAAPYTSPESVVAWRSANDLFAQRLPLTGMAAEATARFSHADRETGEPSHGSAEYNRTLWWTWTAPADGVAELTDQHAAWLAFYEGDSLETLQRVGSGQGTARLDAVGGRTYALVAAASTPIPEDQLTLRFAPAGVPVFQGELAGNLASLQTTLGRRSLDPPPPQLRTWHWRAPTNGVIGLAWNRALFTVDVGLKDLSQPGGHPVTEVASADTLLPVELERLYPAIGGRDYEVTFTAGDQVGSLDGSLRFLTILTNRSFAEPPGFGGREVWNAVTDAAARFPEDAVWFAWTAPEDGLVALTRSTGLEIIVVQGETYPGLPILADTRETTQPFPVQAGLSYRFAVNQAGPSTAVGVVRLAFTPILTPARPVNDDWASAALLAGERVAFTGSIQGATREPGEPLHAGVYGGRSLWWRWVAPADGLAQLSSFPSAGAWHEVAVYRGDRVDGLVPVAARVLPGIAGDLSFPAEAGVGYSVVLDAYHGDPVSSVLELSLARPAPVRFVRLEAQSGSLLLQLEGPPGGGFQLEASPDLMNWSPGVMGTFVGGLGEVTLPIPPNAPPGFFRVRVP